MVLSVLLKKGKTIIPSALVLALAIITAGCAEKERYPERYLDSINLTVHMDRAVEVTGFLRRGVSPDNAIEYPDLTGTSRIDFTCSSQDSAGLAEMLEKASTPFQITSGDNGLPAFVRYWQEGITWRPLYSWNVIGDSCSFSARVSITNSTGREWFSQNTVLKDMHDRPVCVFPDTLVLRNGEMELGWWRKTGTVLPLTIRYGWPQNSQWNQLLPCIVPDAGSLVDTQWPMRTGDTLWIQPVTPLETREQVQVNSTGYDCSLTIHNQNDHQVYIRLIHPELTPRGARFEAENDFPDTLVLQPGDVKVFKYSIEYNR